MSPLHRCAVLAFATLGCMATGTAFSQTQVPPERKAQARAVAQACRADVNRLCPGVQPGEGRLLTCLQGHSGELSPQCRDALSKAAPAK